MLHKIRNLVEKVEYLQNLQVVAVAAEELMYDPIELFYTWLIQELPLI